MAIEWVVDLDTINGTPAAFEAYLKEFMDTWDVAALYLPLVKAALEEALDNRRRKLMMLYRSWVVVSAPRK